MSNRQAIRLSPEEEVAFIKENFKISFPDPSSTFPTVFRITPEKLKRITPTRSGTTYLITTRRNDRSFSISLARIVYALTYNRLGNHVYFRKERYDYRPENLFVR